MSPQNLLSDEELTEKYRNCAKLALSDKATEESLSILKNLERIDKSIEKGTGSL